MRQSRDYYQQNYDKLLEIVSQLTYLVPETVRYVQPTMSAFRGINFDKVSKDFKALETYKLSKRGEELSNDK